jgi:hypothetical protein
MAPFPIIGTFGLAVRISMPSQQALTISVIQSLIPDGKVLKVYASSTVLILGRLVIFVMVIPGMRYHSRLSGNFWNLFFPSVGSIDWPPKKHISREMLLQLAQATSIVMENIHLRDGELDVD